MNFDDHEIWNRPVSDATAVDQPPVVEPTVAPVTAGRLYASAGAPVHPDAVVALPNHTRNFVSVAELPEAPIAEQVAPEVPAVPAPAAPIINDPAIAEVLAPPTTPPATTMPADEDAPSFEWAESIEVKADPLDAFKDWFADDAGAATPPTADATGAAATPVKTGLAAQQLSDAALRARTQLQDLGELVVSAPHFDLRKYSAVTFTFTTFVAVIDAFLGGTLGILFGLGLVVSTAFGAYKLAAADRWVGWVMPAYVAIAAILVAGQFTSSAPGFNIVGQILQIGTTLISIAPWLAASAAIGALLPRFRRG